MSGGNGEVVSFSGGDRQLDNFFDKTNKLVYEDLLRSMLLNVQNSNGDMQTFSCTSLRDDISTRDFCTDILREIKISDNDAIYYSLVLVVCTNHLETTYNILRTMKPEELVLPKINQILSKQHTKYPSSKITPICYYKDSRGYPLDFDGNVSGDSSSDDEDEVSLSDLKYLGQSDRRGYLLKRSSNDENLWRKRFCVLTDKLWYIKVRGSGNRPKTGSINFGNMSIEDISEAPLGYPYGISVQSTSRRLFFRATTSSEQQIWLHELRQRASYSTPNNIMSMAEMIICDEELALNSRLQRSIHNILSTNTSKMSLSSIDEFKSSSSTPSLVALSNKIDVPPQKLISHQTPSPCIFRSISSSMIHSFHSHYHIISTAFAFIASVQRYKELFRHELGKRPYDQWKAALFIFHTYLQPSLDSKEDERIGKSREEGRSDNNNSNSNNNNDNFNGNSNGSSSSNNSNDSSNSNDNNYSNGDGDGDGNSGIEEDSTISNNSSNITSSTSVPLPSSTSMQLPPRPIRRSKSSSYPHTPRTSSSSPSRKSIHNSSHLSLSSSLPLPLPSTTTTIPSSLLPSTSLTNLNQQQEEQEVRQSSCLPISQIHINLVHRKIFNNVRRKSWDDLSQIHNNLDSNSHCESSSTYYTNNNNSNNSSNNTTSNPPQNTSWGFFSWSTSTTSTSTNSNKSTHNGKESSTASNHIRNRSKSSNFTNANSSIKSTNYNGRTISLRHGIRNCIINSQKNYNDKNNDYDYELLDVTVRPSMNIFDCIVEEIELLCEKNH